MGMVTGTSDGFGCDRRIDVHQLLKAVGGLSGGPAADPGPSAGVASSPRMMRVVETDATLLIPIPHSCRCGQGPATCDA